MKAYGSGTRALRVSALAMAVVVGAFAARPQWIAGEEAPPAPAPAPTPVPAAEAQPAPQVQAQPKKETPAAPAVGKEKENKPERPKIRYWLDDAAGSAVDETSQPSRPLSEGYKSPRDPDREALVPPPAPPPLEVNNEEDLAAHRRRAALQNVITLKLDESKRAYKQGDYQRSIDIARNVLTADPNNTDAMQWIRKSRDKMLGADEAVAKAASERRDREVLLDTFEHSIVPPPRLPVERPHLPTRNEDLSTARRKKMSERLEQRITVDFQKADLEFVLNTLFILTGVNLIADQSALDDKSLTLHVEDLPLREVLNFIVRNNDGIQYSVTEDAVWITAAQDTDLKKIMYPRIYPLHYGLVSTTGAEGAKAGQRGGTGGAQTGGAGRSGAGGRTGHNSGGGNSRLVGGGSNSSGQMEPSYIETVLKWLKEAKDSQVFPEGSDYLVDRQSNHLIVYTSPAGHEKIAEMLDYFDQPAIQVLIKTRFLEVSSTNNKELGLNLTDIHTRIGPAEAGAPPNTAEGSISGTTTTTDGTTTTVDVRDPFKLLSFVGPLTPTSTLLTIVGRRTDPQFTATLSALLNNSKIKVLAEPQILAINNKEATIDITQSFYYISAYEPIQSSDVIVGGNTTVTGDTITTQRRQAYNPVFDNEKIGFTLVVTPSVGRDLKTINLHLSPILDELSTDTSFDAFQQVVQDPLNPVTTPPIPKQPVIDQRSFETDVVMEDNGYVIIGGLQRVRVENSEKKIPGLHRIPLLGNLFKSMSNKVTKTNLVIIVESQIISPSGRTYYSPPAADDAGPREGGSNHPPMQTSQKPMPGWMPPESSPDFSGRAEVVNVSGQDAGAQGRIEAAKRHAPPPQTTVRQRMERLATAGPDAFRNRSGWATPQEESRDGAAPAGEAGAGR